MNDSEKIDALIQEKHLTNAQFCAATGLQPAALSHITSGRSRPSLSILRSIVRGFPDVNPMWLFGDEQEMYRVASPSAAVPATPSEIEEDVPPSVDAPTQGQLLPAEETSENAPLPSGAPIVPTTASASEQSGAAAQEVAAATPAAEAPVAPSAAAASTVIVQQVPAPEPPRRRNIVEIRVFYDDNTFEILTRKP